MIPKIVQSKICEQHTIWEQMELSHQKQIVHLNQSNHLNFFFLHWLLMRLKIWIILIFVMNGKGILPIKNVIHEVKTKYIMNVTNVNMNLQIARANIDLLQNLILQDIM